MAGRTCTKKYHRKLLALSAALVFIVPALCGAAEGAPGSQVRPTPFSMDVFGSLEGAEPGDMVTVTDPDGVTCGVFEVRKAGVYGFLHVYGDDPGTREDEGARVGDVLTFHVNGEPLYGPEVLWKGDGQRQRVDFAR